MVALKVKTFEALDIVSTPRSEKVFDMCVDFCMWSVFDGGHTIETVLPLLIASVREAMAGSAYRHLEGV